MPQLGGHYLPIVILMRNDHIHKVGLCADAWRPGDKSAEWLLVAIILKEDVDGAMDEGYYGPSLVPLTGLKLVGGNVETHSTYLTEPSVMIQQITFGQYLLVKHPSNSHIFPAILLEAVEVSLAPPLYRLGSGA